MLHYSVLDFAVPFYTYGTEDVLSRLWGKISRFVVNSLLSYKVIPRLKSDPVNELFSTNEDFFRCFWTRLTNMDSANECFSGCAR